MSGTPFLSKKPAAQAKDDLQVVTEGAEQAEAKPELLVESADADAGPEVIVRPVSSQTPLLAIVSIVMLGAVGGVAMAAFNQWGYVPAESALKIVAGPAAALLIGFWLWQGVLTRLLVPVRGAAFAGSLIAASVSALLGSQWGLEALLYGALQGLGAELVFLAFELLRSRRAAQGLVPAVLAGAASSLFAVALDLTRYYAGLSSANKELYALYAVISGAVIGGLLAWLLARAIRGTGVLSALQPVSDANRV